MLFPLGYIGKGMKLTVHFPLVPRLRKVELFYRSPIHYDNMAFNLLSPEIIYNLKLSVEYFEVVIVRRVS
jgi:hypothetical protein